FRCYAAFLQVPRVRISKTLTLVVVTLMAVVCSLAVTGPMGAGARNVEPQKRKPSSRRPKSKAPAKPKVDYTKFSHTTHTVTQKLACESCHKVPSKNWQVVRKGDAAFAD